MRETSDPKRYFVGLKIICGSALPLLTPEFGASGRIQGAAVLRRCTIMLESSWSDPQSDLTEELGFASAGDSNPAVSMNPSFCRGFAAPRRRCVTPKVQPSAAPDRSDQRVPVYWDQTVPVWQAGGPSSTTERKAGGLAGLPGRCSRGFDGDGASSSETSSLENGCCCCCCCCCSGRDDARDDGSRGADSTGRGDAGASSEVSFDAILSMYESSLVEKSFKWSRRDWWVLGALLKPRRIRKPGVHDATRRRLWPRSFAGRRYFSGISAQLAASGALKQVLGEAAVFEEGESVRRLRVAIERTSIGGPAASATCNTSHRSGGILLRNADAIFQGRRSCDFQIPQLRHRRDPLSFSTPMLTTSSS